MTHGCELIVCSISAFVPSSDASSTPKADACSLFSTEKMGPSRLINLPAAFSSPRPRVAPPSLASPRPNGLSAFASPMYGARKESGRAIVSEKVSTPRCRYSYSTSPASSKIYVAPLWAIAVGLVTYASQLERTSTMLRRPVVVLAA
eukprot:7383716-Prymnesium_polylepis.1